MNILEPYLIFGIISIIFIGIALSYLSLRNFEILIILFAISSIIASIFYDNNPVWITEEIESSFKSYLRGGILVFSGLIGFLIYLMKYKLHNFKVPIHFVVLFCFSIFSFLSVFYSIDTKNTFIRSGLFASVFLFLLSLNFWIDSIEKFNKLLSILFIIVSSVLIINLISMFTIPGRTWWWKNTSRFLGLFSHPNELGGFTIMALPIILWKLKEVSGHTKFIIYPILLLNFILLISTGSRTSLLVSIIGLFIWLFMEREWIKILTAGLLLIIGVLLLTQFELTSYSRNEGDNLVSLTERELIWQASSVFMKERPILGFGYAVEGKIFADQKLIDVEGQFFNPNAQQPLHNGYLSIFIGGGIIGFLLWISAIGMGLYNSLRSEYSKYKGYVLATMIPILIANIVESAITGYLGTTDIFFWFAWVLAGKLSLNDNKANENAKQEVI